MEDYKISRFGRAAMQSGVSPDEAIMLYEDLNRAINGLNLESDLHLLYLVIPQDRGLYPDFQVHLFSCIYFTLIGQFILYLDYQVYILL